MKNIFSEAQAQAQERSREYRSKKLSEIGVIKKRLKEIWYSFFSLEGSLSSVVKFFSKKEDKNNFQTNGKAK